jgi:hypothetical protein
MDPNLSELFRRNDIERVAQQISDPVARLQYIRTTVSREKAVSRRWALLGIAASALPLWSDARRPKSEPAVLTPPVVPAPKAAGAAPDVWPVEHNQEFDLYSNGLRVENRLEVANEQLAYAPLDRDSLAPGRERTQPAGIVFHTTESDQAPFESKHKPALKRIGRNVLLYVRRMRAYHFVIDRFGRVNRVVSESDRANHAGHSIWGDRRWIYLDLNNSFLAVAFEAQSKAEPAPLTSAQVAAGRALTEALRSRYGLAAENCVTHAQVSVNPSNKRIGWHTDWVCGFPFREVGLPDNYTIPNPGLARFGFEYDPPYLNSCGPEMRDSVAAAEEQVRFAASQRGLSVYRYRIVLQQEYAKAEASLRSRSTAEEKEYDQN